MHYSASPQKTDLVIYTVRSGRVWPVTDTGIAFEFEGTEDVGPVYNGGAKQVRQDDRYGHISMSPARHEAQCGNDALCYTNRPCAAG